MSSFDGIFCLPILEKESIKMVSVRKRGKVYEYRFETASVDGTRKWITKSGFPTKQDALNQGALDYNEYYRRWEYVRTSIQNTQKEIWWRYNSRFHAYFP